MEIFINCIKWYSVLLLGVVEISIALSIATSKDWDEGWPRIISFILFAPILLFVIYMFRV